MDALLAKFLTQTIHLLRVSLRLIHVAYDKNEVAKRHQEKLSSLT